MENEQPRFEVNMGQATAEAVAEIMAAENISGTEYLRRVTSLYKFIRDGKLIGRMAVVMGEDDDRV